MTPQIEAFFDEETFTVSYLVWDTARSEAAIVDSVLDFDPKSGRTTTRSADAILRAVEQHRLRVKWILETHAHADHLSAAQYLKGKTGAPVAIGADITKVQAVSRTYSTNLSCRPTAASSTGW